MMELRLSAALCLGIALLAGCSRATVNRSAPEAMPPAAPAEADAYPLTLTDALGKQVVIEAPPQRIVSMSPPITETLFALGLGERIVGVTRFCDYPPAAKEKDKIGGIIDPSLEKTVALNPDIVFVTVGNPLPVLEALEAGGVTVFAVDPKTYEEGCESVETLGRICDVRAVGERVAGEMRAAAADVRARVAGAAERPRALFIVWLDPLFVAGPGTFMDDLLSICGAQNAAGEMDNPWKQHSVEMAVAADPEVLVLSAEHAPVADDAETRLAALRRSPAWRSVAAVKTGRIVLVHGDLVMRTTPRLAGGLRILAEGIHPGLFPPQEQADARTM